MNEQSIKSLRKSTYFPSVIVILGCALWFSYALYQEARYSRYGETVVAKVSHKKQASRGGGKGPRYQVLVLDYSYREASGTQREGQDEVRLDSPLIQADGSMQVEYIPGIGDSSRVKGAKSIFARLGFPGLAFLISSVYLFFAVIARQFQNAAMKRNQQEADVRNAIGSPSFSENALIYRNINWIGKPVSVIVDQDSEKIHFQNCHRPKSFLPAKKHPWFSCALSELRGVHANSHQGNSSLLIVTQKGSATVSSRGSNFKILKEKQPTLLRQGQQCFNSENPLLGILYAIAMIAGVMTSLPLASSANVPLGVTVLGMIGVGFGIARALVAFEQS